jgi:hypothetical protein
MLPSIAEPSRQLRTNQETMPQVGVTMKKFPSFCFGLSVIGSLNAQEVPQFSFDLGGGFTQPVGNTGRHLDEGWNIQGGVGFNFSQIYWGNGPGGLQSLRD